jgi:hypothetical protein
VCSGTPRARTPRPARLAAGAIRLPPGMRATTRRGDRKGHRPAPGADGPRVLLAWALDADGRRLHVDAIDPERRRARAPFRCMACGETLVAKLGSARAHHFAHRPGSACSLTRPETALHLNAKQRLLTLCEEAFSGRRRVFAGARYHSTSPTSETRRRPKPHSGLYASMSCSRGAGSPPSPSRSGSRMPWKRRRRRRWGGPASPPWRSTPARSGRRSAAAPWCSASPARSGWRPAPPVRRPPAPRRGAGGAGRRRRSLSSRPTAREGSWVRGRDLPCRPANRSVARSGAASRRPSGAPTVGAASSPSGSVWSGTGAARGLYDPSPGEVTTAPWSSWRGGSGAGPASARNPAPRQLLAH